MNQKISKIWQPSAILTNTNCKYVYRTNRPFPLPKEVAMTAGFTRKKLPNPKQIEIARISPPF